MKYLLQIYPADGEFEGLSEEEQGAIVGEYVALRQSPGVIGGDQLQPVETATTVRVDNGQALLTDGPFVEAKEHLVARASLRSLEVVPNAGTSRDARRARKPRALVRFRPGALRRGRPAVPPSVP